MTRNQYRRYEANVREFFEREGIENLSGEPDQEGFFSWSPCDCCGSDLGGNREHATGYNRTTNQVQEYVVCVDCIYYAEYGRLDDTTMDEMGL